MPDNSQDILLDNFYILKSRIKSSIKCKTFINTFVFVRKSLAKGRDEMQDYYQYNGCTRKSLAKDRDKMQYFYQYNIIYIF